ncbi:hypothetical protein CHLRE_12g518002v5 [Chlamydomonas reinhardtii]|uniref:Uncharacterized protein n=1 Tax=Chlamydomonas reinhardtii TaxID=3055 RepID=A0A2K3D3Y1_CHLRE|nr:uncharacterized protein CHLRE_12g518002v5 [Chlamydomonas reinhardtii]PNW75227.1 hypothetical protein CHLRE_12g518002v5 [Chlamydomonas reinhardtii]
MLNRPPASPLPSRKLATTRDDRASKYAQSHHTAPLTTAASPYHERCMRVCVPRVENLCHVLLVLPEFMVGIGAQVLLQLLRRQPELESGFLLH